MHREDTYAHLAPTLTPGCLNSFKLSMKIGGKKVSKNFREVIKWDLYLSQLERRSQPSPFCGVMESIWRRVALHFSHLFASRHPICNRFFLIDGTMDNSSRPLASFQALPISPLHVDKRARPFRC